MGSKKTTTTSSTQPTNPDWVTNSVQGLAGKVNDLSQTDPSSAVAPVDPLQTMAGQGAAGLAGTPQNFGDATALTRSALFGGGPSQAGTASSLPSIGSFMNPFVNDVVNSSLAGYDANSARQVQQGQLDAGHGNIGSNFQVGDALLKSEQGLGRGQLQSGLLSNGFNMASQLADSQANRQQQSDLLNAQLGANFQRDQAAQQLAAGGQLANIGAAQDANTRANVGTMSDTGGTLRGVNQNQLSAPYDQLQTLAGISGTLPYGLFQGQNATGTSKTSDSLLGTLGNVAKVAATAAMFSDVRLKRDIIRVGERADGLGVYLYRYLWSPILHLGVMAQEVLRVRPEAVAVHPSGFLMVDYGKLGA